MPEKRKKVSILSNTRKLKYSPEFKAEVCEYAKKESISGSASAYNINRNTISRWIAKLDTHGLEGFISKRKKRNKIINCAEISEITAFKKENPEAKLNDIKEHFKLNCSISLISKRLNQFENRNKSNNIKDDELYFKYHIIKRIKKSSGIESIYRFALYACKGNIAALGFSTSRNSLAICIFISYAVRYLKLKYNRNISKVISNLSAVNKEEFEKIVGSVHNVRLVLTKNINIMRCKDKTIEYNSKIIESAMISSYKSMIKSHNFKEIGCALSAAVFNIDALYGKDLKKESWNTYHLPQESKNSFHEAMNEIKQSGHSAVCDFDYTKAKSEYEIAYSALTQRDYIDYSHQSLLLFEYAKTLFYLEQFQTALMLFRDTAGLSKIQRNNRLLGESNFYLALIHSLYKSYKSSLKYINRSIRCFESKDDENLNNALLYRSLIRKNVIIKDFSQALKNCRLYKVYSAISCNRELICNSISIKGSVLYLSGEYLKAEKALLAAKRFNITSKNYFEALNNLSNLLNIYTFYNTAPFKKIENSLKQLNHISELINFPFIRFEADYRIGIYYYRINEMMKSKIHLEKSICGIKKYGSKHLYFSNLYYLGRSLLETEEYSRSVRILNKLYKEAVDYGDKSYMLFARRIISIVYTKRKNLKMTTISLKKTIKSSLKIKEYHIAGDSYDYLGDIYTNKKIYKKADFCYKEAINNFLKFEIIRNNDLTKEKLAVSAKLLKLKRHIKQ